MAAALWCFLACFLECAAVLALVVVDPAAGAAFVVDAVAAGAWANAQAVATERRAAAKRFLVMMRFPCGEK